MALHNTHIQAVDDPAPARDISSVAICDGIADDVEIQLALDGLATTGGIITLGPGTFTLAATPARAINNVTFEGAGLSTLLNFNGSDAVISAGSQTGWQFKNFNTDAGGVGVGSATAYHLEYWKEGVYQWTPAISGLTATGAELSKTASLPVTAYLRVAEARTFTETAGSSAKVYGASITIPAGAYVTEFAWYTTADWGVEAVTVTMTQGLTGLVSGLDAKAADVMKSAFAAEQGYAGKPFVHFVTEDSLIAQASCTGTRTTTGRGLVLVTYSIPTPVAAT